MPDAGPGGPGGPGGPALDLALRTSADTSGEVQRVLARLEERGGVLAVTRLMANCPTAFRPFLDMSVGLLSRGVLPAADREVMILHVAARRGTPYEWAEHERFSAEVGVTEEQRASLAGGRVDDPALFTAAQLLAVAVADEVLERRQLGADLWERARRTWGEEGAVELLCAVGWWGAFLPTLLDAFGLRSPQR